MFNYLNRYQQELQDSQLAIEKLRNQQLSVFNAKGLAPLRNAYEEIPSYHFKEVDFSQDEVTFGTQASLDNQQQDDLNAKLKNLSPWRKGPFDIAGIKLDAEWQSQHKWQKVLPHINSLEGKRVVDIGSNNGYYMYRMLQQNPEFVLGLDPTSRYYYQFLALQKLTQPNSLAFEPFGVEHLPLYKNFFDTAFCMGIVYHHKDPVSVLRQIHSSLKPDGQIIVESQGIIGDDPVALFPAKTYAKVKGTYFVPTASCLVNWLQRSYFKDIEIFASHPMTNQIQRKTAWMTKQSYDDFLDPKNPKLTIEGYPAPIRIYVKALKRKI